MSPLSPQTRAALAAAGLKPEAVLAVARCALDEDLALGPDVTTDAVVPPEAHAVGDVVSRASGVLAGLPVAAAVLDVAGAVLAGAGLDVAGAGLDVAGAGLDVAGAGAVEVTLRARDGAQVAPGEAVLTAAGPLRVLLTAERTMLNLLGRLCGIATLTRAWVDAIAGTGAAVRDTRKTTPGLRALEKYAVRCGGGVNHRMGLGDEALVKDNHVAAAGSVSAALAAVRAAAPDLPVEVECDTLLQVAEAIAAGAPLVLLDNMSLDDVRAAVLLASPGGTRLEASGGLTLDRAREVAATGVDFLAVGALTHSAPTLDLGFDIQS